MILNIAIKEITELVRDPWVRRLAMGYQILLLVSLVLSGWAHVRMRTEREAAQAAARQTWINQGSKSPLAATYFGMLAFPPQPPMAILDSGVLPYLGQVAHLRAGAGTSFDYPEALDRGVMAELGPLRPAFCLQLLFPLLMIMVLHTLLSRERESGLERYLQALGVNPATMFFGKILAGAMAALALFAVSAILIVLTLFLAGPLPVDDLPALALLLCLYVLYYGAVLWLIFAVAALFPSGHASVGSLVGLWLLMGILIPAGSADWSRGQPLAPTAIEVSRILKSDLETGMPGEFPTRELRSETSLQMLLNQLGVGKREQLPISYPATHLMTEEELMGLSIDRRLKAAREVTAAQSNALRELSSLSPVVAIRTLSQVLCGTDPEQRWASWTEIETARRRFIRILNRDMAANAKASTGELERGKALWDSVDLVKLDPPVTLDYLGAHARQIVTLLMWFAGLALAAFSTVLLLPRRRARA